MSNEEDAARARRSDRNRRHYAKSKAAHEHVLLRLDPGGIASLDAAAQLAGFTRASFARVFLPAILDATGSRLAAIDAARAASGLSLPQFLARALDDALAKAAAAPHEPPPAADEFDALFN